MKPKIGASTSVPFGGCVGFLPEECFCRGATVHSSHRGRVVLSDFSRLEWWCFSSKRKPNEETSSDLQLNSTT